MSARRALTGLLWLAVCWAAAAPLRADTVYVSDELTVPVRSGPSSEHRILRIVRAGTRLDAGEREGGFTRVTLNDGLEGWIPDQYLLDTPIARDRLEAVNRELERARAQVTDLQNQLRAVRDARGSAEQSSADLSEEVVRLEAELADIRRMSANAIDVEAANRELRELNGRLRRELEDLLDERDQLVEQAEQRWMMIGGGLVLAGLLLGILIKSRPRRSAWS